MKWATQWKFTNEKYPHFQIHRNVAAATNDFNERQDDPLIEGLWLMKTTEPLTANTIWDAVDGWGWHP